MIDRGITVKELLLLCSKEVKKGNGDKHILISDDDEGNGFHTLFYGFDDSKDGTEYAIAMEHDNHNADEVIVLG